MARGRLNNVQIGVTAVASGGAGAFTLAASAVNADFDTPAQAGAASGATYGWLATDAGNKHQLFLGTLTNTAGTWTLSRDTTYNSSAGTGANETFSTAAVITSVALAADFARAAGGDFRAGTDADLIGTPKALMDAMAFATLTDAATIAVDFSTFINASVTLGGNRTLGAPSNLKDGQSGLIKVVQDGTGSRTLSYASAWKFAGGAPTVSTAAGTVDAIAYVVDGTVVRANLLKAFA